MKTIGQLNNVERSKLLFQLFPAEIPALLEFATGVYEAIAGDKEHGSATWNNGLFSFEAWLSIAEDVAKRIAKYNKQLHRSRHLFGDQLFDGYNAIFMAHCLILFTTTRQHPNRKFALAVDLLFNP